MLTNILKYKYTNYLAKAGIRLNGSDPWDIKVLDERLYKRIFTYGSIGLGEAYMDNWWECEQLDEMFTRLLSMPEVHPFKMNIINNLLKMRAILFNLQKMSRAFRIGEKHYDISNELFEKMLDSYMNYSCAYWKDADNLDTAQQQKMDLICRKLKLEKGMKILDIGCGWGGMAKFAAQNYDVSVTGITVSSKQAEYARQFCQGLPVEIILQDYRSLSTHYDRAYSIGMFEHIGRKNYRTYMEKVSGLLDKGSIFVLQTIGGNSSVHNTDPWIEKYIFPNSMLPSCQQISKASEDLFIMENWDNFDLDYAQTLMAWYDNFNHAWNGIKTKYDQYFYRMWEYYLLLCAASFRARSNQLWQIVLSPGGVAGGYRTPKQA